MKWFREYFFNIGIIIFIILLNLKIFGIIDIGWFVVFLPIIILIIIILKELGIFY